MNSATIDNLPSLTPAQWQARIAARTSDLSASYAGMFRKRTGGRSSRRLYTDRGESFASVRAAADEMHLSEHTIRSAVYQRSRIAGRRWAFRRFAKVTEVSR